MHRERYRSFGSAQAARIPLLSFVLIIPEIPFRLLLLFRVRHGLAHFAVLLDFFGGGPPFFSTFFFFLSEYFFSLVFIGCVYHVTKAGFLAG